MPNTHFFMPNTHFLIPNTYYTKYTLFSKVCFLNKHSKNVVLYNPDFDNFVIGVFGHVFRGEMQKLNFPEFVKKVRASELN